MYASDLNLAIEEQSAKQLIKIKNLQLKCSDLYHEKFSNHIS